MASRIFGEKKKSTRYGCKKIYASAAKIFTGAALIFFGHDFVAVGQGLAPDTNSQSIIDRQLNRSEKDLFRPGDRKERNAQDSPDIFLDRPDSESDAGPTRKQGEPCITIKNVSLAGVEEIGGTPSLIDSLKGTCATVKDIKFLVNSLNTLYQAKGLITTRVYIPKQNLKDGSLELVALPGRVSDFQYKTGPKDTDRAEGDSRLWAAFPLAAGDIVSLRDLEQGLENFNRPPSQKGKFKLYPGKQAGESVIAVEAQQEWPVRLSFSLDTTGSEAIGRENGSLDLGVDNILGLNDTWVVGVTRTLPIDADGMAESYTAEVALPFGYWHFAAGAGFQRYSLPIRGINQDYELSGYGHNIHADLERLLYRDDATKLYGHIGYLHSRNRNFLEDEEIATQRRYLTSFAGGLNVVRYFGDIALDVDLTYRKGMLGLGAQKPYVRGIFNPRYHLFEASVELSAPVLWDLALFSSTAKGQWTNNTLPGAERLYIGGLNSVRGFREEYLYGDRGFFIQNTLEVPVPLPFQEDLKWLKLSALGGIDYGLIDPLDNFGYSQNDMVGFSSGLRVQLSDILSVEAAYERSLTRPREFEDSRNQVNVGVNLSLSSAVKQAVELVGE